MIPPHERDLSRARLAFTLLVALLLGSLVFAIVGSTPLVPTIPAYDGPRGR